MNRPADDLAAIRRLMHDSQQAVVDSGKHFILWGLITAVGLAVTYAAVTRVLPVNATLVWVVLIAAGWVASLRIGAADHARARVRGPGQRLLALIWIGCGTTLTLIASAGMFGGAIAPQALPGLVAAIVGLGFLATSAVAGMTGARYLAVAWWIGGGSMLFLPGMHTLLVLAAMALALQVAPGVSLYMRARRAAHPSA